MVTVQKSGMRLSFETSRGALIHVVGCSWHLLDFDTCIKINRANKDKINLDELN